MTTTDEAAAMPQVAPACRSSPLIEKLCAWRVRIGLLMVIAVVAQAILWRERPLDLLNPGNAAVRIALAFAAIGLGMLLRIAALGQLRKNESLAQTGIYSLCRHPLYLGSAILYVGFAILMNDPTWDWWWLGLPYLVIFFSAAAIREERFLAQKFGEEFQAYRARTPAFVPLGHYNKGTFSLSRAMKKGGLQLILVVLVLLAGVQTMSRVLT